MNPAAGLLAAMFSVLIPTKQWFALAQPDTIDVKAKGDVTLVLTDFTGKKIDPKGSADVSGEKTVDVKQLFPVLEHLGAFVLYAVPKGKDLSEFEGTPLVIEVRQDRRHGGEQPMVTKVEPLRYAVMQTEHGPLTMVFYFDVAPVTADSFLRLAEEGFYDGLTFHRILPGFVLQGGDPRGNGTGGPGYELTAEFNDRPHEPGVLSMAREGDPQEGAGMAPGRDYANSAGSQFFICLDYNQTKHLDRKYTAFGKVVDGMKAVQEIAKTPLSNPQAGTPQTPQVIKSVTVKPVTAQDNPYAEMFHLKGGTK